MIKKTHTNREIERQLIDFAGHLEEGMTPAEIASLYEKVEEEHWLSESKVLLMRTIFHSVLKEQEEQMAPPMPDELKGIFS